MSPENDNNPQPSAMETSSVEPTTGNLAGAATAVVRAHEPPESVPTEANPIPLETASTEAAGAEAAPPAEAVSTEAAPATEPAQAAATETSDSAETPET